MRRLMITLLATLFAVASVNALACPADKAKDGKGEMSAPAKPKA